MGFEGRAVGGRGGFWGGIAEFKGLVGYRVYSCVSFSLFEYFTGLDF